MKKTGIAIVGCGNISNAYAETLKPYAQLELIGAADIDPARARDFAAKHGGIGYDSLDSLLADERVEIVINLTIHHAHVEVITKCLKAGKHVHSEKPLAMTYAEAAQLVDLAKQRSLRLSCAPIGFLGEAQQTAMKMIRDGRLGKVRVAYAEVNWARIESWHPNPVPFYEVGPVYDVGVYPLTILTAIFGPAKRVTAFGQILKRERTTKSGEGFTLATPEYFVVNVEFADGAVARLTVNFYVKQNSKQPGGIEFHGDDGSLYLESWSHFNSAVYCASYDGSYEPVPLLGKPFVGVEWGRGVTELQAAIEEGRAQRATGEQAAHVVEICSAIHGSAKTGRAVDVHSNFDIPAPADWARESLL
jgi:predicted dehydrogenase